MKHYVLFKHGRAPGCGYSAEIYVGGVLCGEPAIVRQADIALTFPTARRAYEYGARNRFDDWQVGLR